MKHSSYSIRKGMNDIHKGMFRDQIDIIRERAHSIAIDKLSNELGIPKDLDQYIDKANGYVRLCSKAKKNLTNALKFSIVNSSDTIIIVNPRIIMNINSTLESARAYYKDKQLDKLGVMCPRPFNMKTFSKVLSMITDIEDVFYNIKVGCSFGGHKSHNIMSTMSDVRTVLYLERLGWYNAMNIQKPTSIAKATTKPSVVSLSMAKQGNGIYNKDEVIVSDKVVGYTCPANNCPCGLPKSWERYL